MRRYGAATAIILTLATTPSVAAPPPGPGAETYAEHCASCHGAEGEPELPGTPDFTRGQGLDKSDRATIDAIRYGIGVMPGFEGLIENEDLIDVLYYIRALQH